MPSRRPLLRRLSIGAAPAARLAAFAIALLCAPDCTETAAGGDGATGKGATTDSTDSATATTDGAVVSAAVWTLAWDTEGVTFPEEGGLEVETDLGYRVHADIARVLSHSVSFGPCDSAQGTTTAHRFFGLPIRAAHAHTDGTDPSSIETSLIEDLTHPGSTDVDSSFAPARYCRAHWLLARPMTKTSGPGDVSMDHRSLYVTGTFERSGAAAPLVVDTWWPEGRLVDLSEVVDESAYAAARDDSQARHAFVIVTRHLARMFDGIDFEVATADQIQGRMIDNLVGSADVEVKLWAPSASN